MSGYEHLQYFLELGGNVLLLIGLLALLMWALIFERMFYFFSEHQKVQRWALQTWAQRTECHSWYAHKIREQLVSVVASGLQKNLVLINTCVALAPLLGLLGTVTGMIEVFDAMAISGFGNARAMAAGFSKATIPTMAGMVVAISGLALALWLRRQANYQRQQVIQQMTLDEC